MARPQYLEWQRETAREGRELVQAAIGAARAVDPVACLRAARVGAAYFLHAYLKAAGCEETAQGDDLRSLLEAAVGQDGYFARLRPEVELLQTPEPAASQLLCEDFAEALKEIRMLVVFRGCTALGADADRTDLDPCVEQFVVHSTTAQRTCSIFAQGALYSYKQCVQRGLLTGTPPGVKYLLDPRRWLDFVFFHRPDARYYAGEKVAHAHRMGQIDEEVKDDYQASARLFFDRATLEALPGWEDDGIPSTMVRDAVPLDNLAYAVFPTESVREQALAAVMDPALADRLRPRCLVAPANCRADPTGYVSATNALVADQVDRGSQP